MLPQESFQETAQQRRAQRRARLDSRRIRVHRQQAQDDTLQRQEIIRHQNAVRQQTRRSRLTEQQHQQDILLNAQQHRTAYAGLNEEERAQCQQQDAQQHRSAYAGLSEEERAQRQQQDAQQHRTAYAGLSEEERAQRQQQDALQHRNRRRQPSTLYRVATESITVEQSVPPHSIGSRSNICSYCHALRWPLEATRGTICCSKGKNGNLQHIFPAPLPPVLHDLFTWDISTNVPSPTGFSATTIRRFRTNLRQYNCALQMASSGMKIQQPRQPGISMIVAKGAVYHDIGPLVPTGDNAPKFAQLYIIDNDLEEVDHRLSHFARSAMNRELLHRLQVMLHAVNPFVLQFRQIIQDIMQNNLDLEEREIYISTDGNVDHRRYNQPTGFGQQELAGIMPGSEEIGVDYRREIRIRAQGGPNDYGIHKISDAHKFYDSLHFVLFHPQGQQGWEKNGILLLNPPRNESRQRRRNGNGTFIDDEALLDADNLNEEQAIQDNEIPIQTERGRGRQIYVSEQGYAVYFMHDRNPQDHSLFVFGKKLYQEWMVDQFCKVESRRLLWLMQNQKTLRSDVYQGLTDAMQTGDTSNLNNLGQRIILPSTHIGSPRYLRQLFQDAMGIVRALGRPDYFITMTCNPNWSEIKDALKPGEVANDRPDLISRVFRLKLNAFLKFLTKDKIVGEVIGHIHVIEFQKRGLPHAHILLIVSDQDKPRSANDFDQVVCAEIPDKDQNPRLWGIVTRNMLHGPCGTANPRSGCMKNGKCRFGYPKEFAEETRESDEHSYPIYRRRNNGRTFQKTEDGYVYDNRSVAPYNAWLSLTFDCHINMEICSNITAVKYIYKYIYKGPDRAEIVIGAPPVEDEPVLNEIRDYHQGRYISASEASWRLLQFSMHREFPSVQRLEVHLPEQQQVMFNEDGSLMGILTDARHTRLTRWFEFNKRKKEEHSIAFLTDPEAQPHPCLQTLYHNFPRIASWDQSHKNWKERAQRLNDQDESYYVYKEGYPPVGRVYFVHPKEGERYFLRLLLMSKPGATSYDDLKTTNDSSRNPSHFTHASFQDACRDLGLLQDDYEWIRCMELASTFASADQLRHLFVSLLLYNSLSNPLQLWDTFKKELSEDYFYQARNRNRDQEHGEQIFNKALRAIRNCLKSNGRDLADYQLPIPADLVLGEGNVIIDEERSRYDHIIQQEVRDTSVPMLNEQQQLAYNMIMNSVHKIKDFYVLLNEGRRTVYPDVQNCYFIDGLGGAGKTFLYNTLLATVRAEDGIAIAVASSGIAALLLEGGRTAHSRLKIPVNGISELSTCNMTKQSNEAEFIQVADIIIWDEAPMQHKHTFEAVDRTFKDLTGIDKPFGGKVVIMGGDFRQVLPVIPRAGRTQVVEASLNRSFLWSHVCVLTLHQNMRVQRMIQDGDHTSAAGQQEFSDWLKRIGEGTEKIYQQHGSHAIHIPSDMCIGCRHQDTVSTLIDAIYGDLNNIRDWESRAQYIMERAILTPLNADVDAINKEISSTFLKNNDGSSIIIQKYFSADSILEHERNAMYPTEYLNKLNLSGIPPHSLDLFVGCPIMLLKNMTGGLANGTRLIITRLMARLIEAQVTTGPSKNQIVLIPRINHTPANPDKMPFTLQRRQFPVRPAFAMTINKSQGQTFRQIGVYIKDSVFSHGQLYVALSRVGSRDGIKFMVKDGWK